MASVIVGTPKKDSLKPNVTFSSRTDRFVPLYDETGSTVAVLSQGPKPDGKFVLQYRVEYDPSGNPRKLTPTFDYDSDQWEHEDPFPYLYAGQRYDAETGLYHTEARQYHPRLGAVANPAVSGYELPSERVQPITPQEISGPPENFLSFPYNPTIPDARSPIQTIAHTVFAVGGMIPGYGALFDVADAILYAAEGDYQSAGFSLAAAVPIVGDVAAGAKWVTNAQKAMKAAKQAGNVAKVSRATRAAVTAIKYRRQVDMAINFGISGYYAGHGVATGNPWEIGTAAFGIGLNGAFAARMLKNAGGARGLLARRSAPRSGLFHGASDDVVRYWDDYYRVAGHSGDDLTKTIADLKRLGFDVRLGDAASFRTGTNILKYGPNTKVWELYEEAIHHSVGKGLGQSEISALTKQLRKTFRNTRGNSPAAAAEEIFVKTELLRRIDLDAATRQLLARQIEKLRLRGLVDGY